MQYFLASQHTGFRFLPKAEVTRTHHTKPHHGDNRRGKIRNVFPGLHGWMLDTPMYLEAIMRAQECKCRAPQSCKKCRFNEIYMFGPCALHSKTYFSKFVLSRQQRMLNLTYRRGSKWGAKKNNDGHGSYTNAAHITHPNHVVQIQE